MQTAATARPIRIPPKSPASNIAGRKVIGLGIGWYLSFLGSILMAVGGALMLALNVRMINRYD